MGVGIVPKGMHHAMLVTTGRKEEFVVGEVRVGVDMAILRSALRRFEALWVF